MKEKGKVDFRTIIFSIVCAILIPIVIVMLMNATSSFSPFAAISLLEGRGYFVASADEYDTLNAKLDSIAIKAYAAVANADAAVNAAEDAVDAAQLAVAKVDLFNTAERLVYPTTTNLTCTLTAGETNAWGNWAQITDSGGGNLSSCFSVNTGYITDMQIFDHSAADKIYLVEIAFGSAKNIIGRVAYHTSFADNVDIKSELIPVGETVYYRMMSSGVNGATARVGFRYIYE